MATTTNYSWTTPDDTALVKDGASAIRSLGTAIDTTTKNLNPSTTLGDVEYRSSTANTNTRLAIGSTGQVLTVAGGVPSWATPSSGGMTLLSTTTLSGASTTISTINQNYNDLQIVILGATSSSNFRNTLKINNDAALTSYSEMLESGGSTFHIAVNDGLITLGNNLNNSSSNTENAAVIKIFNYASTANSKPFFCDYGYIRSSGGNEAGSQGGYYRSTSAVSSLVFAPTAGNFSAGTVLVYGVK